MTCGLCGATETVPTPITNIFGRGVDLVQCTTCGVKYYTPGDNVQSPENFYNSTAFDEYVRRCFTTGSPFHDPQLSREEYVKHHESMFKSAFQAMAKYSSHFSSVYEVGCGWGEMLKVAQDMGFVVGGCDLSREACRQAQQLGLNVEHACFQDASVPQDLCGIIMWDMIEHTTTPGADLDRAARHLRQGGCLLIKTFYDEFHWFKDYNLTDRQSRDGVTGDLDRTGYYCPDSHPYNFETGVLLRAMEQRKFKIVDVSHNLKYGQITVYGVKE